MLSVERRLAAGYLPEATDERNAVEFLLDLCFRPAAWAPDQLSLHRSGNQLILDFAHMRAAHDLLHTWLDTPEKMSHIEAGLRHLNYTVEVRLRGKLLGVAGPEGGAKPLTALFSLPLPQ